MSAKAESANGYKCLDHRDAWHYYYLTASCEMKALLSLRLFPSCWLTRWLTNRKKCVFPSPEGHTMTICENMTHINTFRDHRNDCFHQQATRSPRNCWDVPNYCARLILHIRAAVSSSTISSTCLTGQWTRYVFSSGIIKTKSVHTIQSSAEHAYSILNVMWKVSVLNNPWW
jgi:hypothetical protein